VTFENTLRRMLGKRDKHGSYNHNLPQIEAAIKRIKEGDKHIEEKLYGDGSGGIIIDQKQQTTRTTEGVSNNKNNHNKRKKEGEKKKRKGERKEILRIPLY
jgi:hypothetical protein